MTIMSNNEIMNKLIELLETKFQVSNTELVSDCVATPLTTAPFYMDAIKLTYLYFEVSKLFDLDFSFDDLAEYSFLTIGNICDLIYQKIESSTMGYIIHIACNRMTIHLGNR
jgi:acyl carrier protein